MNLTERLLRVFARTAAWWDALSRDEQERYLKDHPHSKRKITSPAKDEKPKRPTYLPIPEGEEIFREEGMEHYDEAEKELSAAYAKDNFTKDQLYELESYTGSAWDDRASYREVNLYSQGRLDDLEDTFSSKEKIEHTMHQLDNALDGHKSPVSFLAYRGLQAKPSMYRKGATYNCASFMSTSINPDVSSRFAQNGWAHKGSKPCVLCLSVPKGAKGAYVANLTWREHEREFLMPRNTKFKVIGKSEVRGVWYIHAKILP